MGVGRWRLTIPGHGCAEVLASSYDELSTETLATVEFLGAKVPREYQGRIWSRWIQRAMWGDGPSVMGDWRLEKGEL